MANTIRTCIITGYGINADRELENAFIRAGSTAERVHVRDLMEDPARLEGYQILAFPGGFSFGDHLGSGIVLAHVMKSRLGEALRSFVERDRLAIGICNGFQVLVKMGFLPNASGQFIQEASLVHNESGLFENSWVGVRYESKSHCVWTRGLTQTELPIRHGEGRFIVRDDQMLAELENRNLVALRYEGRNPNGSVADIAGVTDPSGRILGLMPHPEAFIRPEQHPRWHRRAGEPARGLEVFERGVRYFGS